MELRDIEILLTLADELHFGRTAERLHLTTSKVSTALENQERRIGARLFERTSRKVVLTPIGVQLVDDLRPHFDGVRHALEHASRTARQRSDVLRLGMISGNTGDLEPLFARFEQHRPECTVRVRSLPFVEPFRHLRRSELDVAVVWLPVWEDDLTVGPVVWTEPVVLATSSSDPLATRESVSYEDIADREVIGGALPDYWREGVIPSHAPSGRPITIGPTVRSVAEALPIVASGEAVAFMHMHALRYQQRPDIEYVPIDDASPTRWVLVWRSSSESDLIRDLARTVEEIGPLLR